MGARQHGTLLALLCTLLFCHRAAAGTLQPDAALVVQELQHLATFSDDPNPAVTRVLFTENDVRARDYVKQLMREAGLTVREDSVGNIFGRCAARGTGVALRIILLCIIVIRLVPR